MSIEEATVSNMWKIAPFYRSFPKQIDRTMKTEGFQCLTCDSEVIESLEELERQELKASLRGSNALYTSSRRRFPVQCTVTHNAGPFIKVPLAYVLHFGMLAYAE
jgi:copper chaperone CopZ